MLHTSCPTQGRVALTGENVTSHLKSIMWEKSMDSHPFLVRTRFQAVRTLPELEVLLSCVRETLHRQGCARFNCEQRAAQTLEQRIHGCAKLLLRMAKDRLLSRVKERAPCMLVSASVVDLELSTRRCVFKPICQIMSRHASPLS